MTPRVHREVAWRDAALPLMPRKTVERTIAPAVDASGSPAVAALLDEAWQQGFEQGREAMSRELREAATTEGFEKGFGDALAQARAKAAAELADLREQHLAQARQALETKLQNLDAISGSLRNSWVELFQAAEADVVATVHEVLCRMLGQCAADPATIGRMVADLLSRQRDGHVISIGVHPDDLGGLAGRGGWNWVADPEVQLGGVIVRTGQTRIDARLEVQLEALRHALLATRAERRGVAP